MPQVPPSRPAGGSKAALGFTALFALDALLRVVLHAVNARIRLLFDLGLSGGSEADFLNVVRQLLSPLHAIYAPVLYIATFIALVRVFTRPLRRRTQGTRFTYAAFASRHPVLLNRVLPWLPGALMMAAYLAGTGWDELAVSPLLGCALAALVGAVGIRFGLKQLGREPTAEEAAAEAAQRASADQSSFGAVAVTPTTRGIVYGFAAGSLAATAYAAATPIGATLGVVVAAYVLSAVVVTTVFRRVSRITVGIDGVLVVGAGRTQFFGYAGFDDVREHWGDIVLERKGRVAVRLQLDDTDRGRVKALVQRLRVAMEQAARLRNEGAGRLMEATQAAGAGKDRLVSSSRGGLDYRQPAMAREQLWELLEGPLADAEARKVAASALAADLREGERGRLRVAAEQCADPRVRVAIQRLADEEEAEADEVVEAPRRALPLPGTTP